MKINNYSSSSFYHLRIDKRGFCFYEVFQLQIVKQILSNRQRSGTDEVKNIYLSQHHGLHMNQSDTQHCELNLL